MSRQGSGSDEEIAMLAPQAGMSEQDLQALAKAVERLEHPGFAAYFAYLAGMPVEKALGALSPRWSDLVNRVSKLALSHAYSSAASSLRGKPWAASSVSTHKWLAGASGGLGGALGLAGLALELPLSASIMLRAIADIARSHGENPEDEATRAACLEVFAMSGKQPLAQSADTGYYALRALLSKAIRDAGAHIGARGLAKEGAPVVVSLINIAAARFSIPVSQKLALQSVPLLGAASGASINLLFVDYFQKLADAHFTVRRLERSFGEAVVKDAYTELANTGKTRNQS